MKSVSYGSALRMGIASLLAAAALISVSVLWVVEASGRKGHTQNTNSSLSLVLLNSTDGQPHWGQQVTFTASTTATTQPFVQLSCYQAGVLVYSFSAGFYPGYPWTQIYTLKSNAWTGGPAGCTAMLYSADGGRETILATLSVPVSP